MLYPIELRVQISGECSKKDYPTVLAGGQKTPNGRKSPLWAHDMVCTTKESDVRLPIEGRDS
jgi:hypothetical protein